MAHSQSNYGFEWCCPTPNLLDTVARCGVFTHHISHAVECNPVSMGRLMKKVWMIFSVLLAIGFGLGTSHAQYVEGQPAVVKLDPALDDLISTSAKLEKTKGDYF